MLEIQCTCVGKDKSVEICQAYRRISVKLRLLLLIKQLIIHTVVQYLVPILKVNLIALHLRDKGLYIRVFEFRK